jgi:hypothetical protein
MKKVKYSYGSGGPTAPAPVRLGAWLVITYGRLGIEPLDLNAVQGVQVGELG